MVERRLLFIKSCTNIIHFRGKIKPSCSIFHHLNKAVLHITIIQLAHPDAAEVCQSQPEPELVLSETVSAIVGIKQLTLTRDTTVDMN